MTGRRSSDAVDPPKHYNSHPSGVEAIEIVERLGFCLGNAVKYLWRIDKKGSSIENLKKSAWYLRRAIGQHQIITMGKNEYIPLDRVLEHEQPGSVLRDVLEFVVLRLRNFDPPRIADALARVEREIAERIANHTPDAESFVFE